MLVELLGVWAFDLEAMTSIIFDLNPPTHHQPQIIIMVFHKSFSCFTIILDSYELVSGCNSPGGRLSLAPTTQPRLGAQGC